MDARHDVRRFLPELQEGSLKERKRERDDCTRQRKYAHVLRGQAVNKLLVYTVETNRREEEKKIKKKFMDNRQKEENNQRIL